MTQTHSRPAGNGAAAEQVSETSSQSTQPYRWDARAAYQRRRDAAHRLPPLDCGCRDPESIAHREGRCRYRRRRSA